MKARHVILYSGLMLLNAAVTAFAVELAAGHVPLPDRYAWVAPILIAVLTSLGMLLPRAGDQP